jgi:hypothetical protein
MLANLIKLLGKKKMGKRELLYSIIFSIVIIVFFFVFDDFLKEFFFNNLDTFENVSKSGNIENLEKLEKVVDITCKVDNIDPIKVKENPCKLSYKIEKDEGDQNFIHIDISDLLNKKNSGKIIEKPDVFSVVSKSDEEICNSILDKESARSFRKFVNFNKRMEFIINHLDMKDIKKMRDSIKNKKL